MITRIMPAAMIVLSIAAALIYIASGDYKRGTYWLAAAVLNVTVTL